MIIIKKSSFLSFRKLQPFLNIRDEVDIDGDVYLIADILDHDLYDIHKEYLEYSNKITSDILMKIREYKATLIRQKASKLLEELIGKYSKEERETWYIQREEALKYLENPANIPVMLTEMASARTIDLSEMVNLVMENVNTFTRISGNILGIQQKLLVHIYNSETMEDILNTEWP